MTGTVNLALNTIVPLEVQDTSHENLSFEDMVGQLAKYIRFECHNLPTVERFTSTLLPPLLLGPRPYSRVIAQVGNLGDFVDSIPLLEQSGYASLDAQNDLHLGHKGGYALAEIGNTLDPNMASLVKYVRSNDALAIPYFSNSSQLTTFLYTGANDSISASELGDVLGFKRGEGDVDAFAKNTWIRGQLNTFVKKGLIYKGDKRVVKSNKSDMLGNNKISLRLTHRNLHLTKNGSEIYASLKQGYESFCVAEQKLIHF